MNFFDGEILLFDKPYKWTSFDIVNKIRLLIKKKYGKKLKVGHTGTLDPLATGLLIVCTGKMTKKINDYQYDDKEYVAKIAFGATRPSFDKETEIDNYFDNKHITIEQVTEVLNTFLGEQMQTPPIFSAKRVNGKKAYESARKGKDVEVQPTKVNFKRITLMEHDLPNTITVKMLVSKGTYIRSFAKDLGQKLQSGAYLDELVRTQAGKFVLENAITVEQFEKIIQELPELAN
jgi:tRNA pseudouridine55 synthase